MTWRALRIQAAALGVALAAAPALHAQQAPADEAQRLFFEGRDAIERGDYATGCPKFEESLKLVTRASTLLNLAQCDERDGRLIRALERWKKGAGLLDPIDERLKIAMERASSLEQRIPRLTVRLAEGAPAGTQVKLDGALLGEADLEAPRPQEPGKHVVTLEAPGQPAQEFPIELEERDQKEVFLQPGAPIREVVVQTASGGGTRRTLGFVLGGVGVAGAIAAGITGAVIVSRDGDIDEACPEARCTPDGRQLINGSETLLVVNAISWGVGLAGLGAGAVLLLTSDDDDDALKASVGAAALPGGLGLSVRGSF